MKQQALIGDNMHINYTHNTLTAIYGKEYAKVLATKSTINPYLKEAIDKAKANLDD